MQHCTFRFLEGRFLKKKISNIFIQEILAFFVQLKFSGSVMYCLLKGMLYNALSTTEYSFTGFPLLQTLFMTF